MENQEGLISCIQAASTLQNMLFSVIIYLAIYMYINEVTGLNSKM